MNKTEIWKDVSGYEGLYRISNYGKVKSYPGNGPRTEQLKPYKMKCGYLRFSLYKNKLKKTYLAHRLVLQTFVGPCPHGMVGCHNDGIRDNNFVGNLRWDTFYNNSQDMIMHKTNLIKARGSKSGLSKLNELQVRIIKHLLKKGYLIQKEIAKIFDVSAVTISDINNNKTWKHVIIDLSK